MEDKIKRKNIASKEDYKIKIVFNEESIVDINKVLKENFLLKIRNEKNNIIL
jgi:hypothetical protein